MTLCSAVVALALSSPPVAAPTSPATPAAPQRSSPAAHLTTADGQQRQVPLFDEGSAGVPVAEVDGDVVTLGQLTRAVAGAHRNVKEQKVGHQDFQTVLGRLLDVRLLLLEATDMGMRDLPEVKNSIAEYEQQALRELLQARALRGVKADPKEVDRRYKDATREWKARSVLIAKEADAKPLRAALAEAKDFDALAQKLVTEQRATGGAPPEFIPADKLLPQVVAALSKLKPGQVTEPVQVQGGFTVLKLEATRHRDDPARRAEAEEAALAIAKQRAVKRYYDGLVKKHVKVDEKLLLKIDFDAPKPGLASFKKDQRVIARIDGKPALRLGELATTVEQQFYHGTDQAVKSKRANQTKLMTIDALVSQKLVPAEARRLKLDQTPEYRDMVKEFADSLVFRMFVEKAVVPDVKVPEADVRAYHEKHRAEYRYPAMYKLDSLAFRDAKAAQAAAQKLKSGTDLKWLKQNADGQVPDVERAVIFDGAIVAATTMPASLARLLDGTKKGDVRLYEDEKKFENAILVLDTAPSGEKPFDAVRGDIEAKLFNERLTAAIREWSDKLKKAHPVRIYLTKVDI